MQPLTLKQRWALAGVILSSSVVFLDGTVVNLALPHIGRQFGGGLADLQWVAEGYLLALSALILVGGTLGDLRGRKRMYLTGLVGFGLTSLLCAAAPSMPLLIAARVLQGVCGALLIPGALAIIETNFEPGQRGSAFGRWTAWTSGAMIVGPLLGGYIIDVWSWRWIFFLNLPLVVASVLLGLANITESRDPKPRRLDWVGATLAALVLAGLTYGLVEGPARQWEPLELGALIAGLVLLPVFLWHQLHTHQPMLEVRLFRSRVFTGVNLMTFAMYGALGGFMFALVIYLQNGLGWTSLAAGLSTMPMTLIMLVLSRRAGEWAAKRGARLFLTVGPWLAAAGMVWLAPLRPGADYLTGVLPGIGLFGLGMALLVAPLTTTVMGAVDEAHVGIASAINNAVARVSGLLVVAVLGLLGVGALYPFATGLSIMLAFLAGLIAWFMLRP
jgi:EmrB/QacA subfamily drug resistance transporter